MCQTVENVTVRAAVSVSGCKGEMIASFMLMVGFTTKFACCVRKLVVLFVRQARFSKNHSSRYEFFIFNLLI